MCVNSRRVPRAKSSREKEESMFKWFLWIYNNDSFAYNFHIFFIACLLVKGMCCSKTLLRCESITFFTALSRVQHSSHSCIMSRFSWSFYDFKWSFVCHCRARVRALSSSGTILNSSSGTLWSLLFSRVCIKKLLLTYSFTSFMVHQTFIKSAGSQSSLIPSNKSPKRMDE